jgi:hypothetical protein
VGSEGGNSTKKRKTSTKAYKTETKASLPFPPPTQIGALMSKVWQKYFFFSFLPLDHNKHKRYFMISKSNGDG